MKEENFLSNSGSSARWTRNLSRVLDWCRNVFRASLFLRVWCLYRHLTFLRTFFICLPIPLNISFLSQSFFISLFLSRSNSLFLFLCSLYFSLSFSISNQNVLIFLSLSYFLFLALILVLSLIVYQSFTLSIFLPLSSFLFSLSSVFFSYYLFLFSMLNSYIISEKRAVMYVIFWKRCSWRSEAKTNHEDAISSCLKQFKGYFGSAVKLAFSTQIRWQIVVRYESFNNVITTLNKFIGTNDECQCKWQTVQK